MPHRARLFQLEAVLVLLVIRSDIRVGGVFDILDDLFVDPLQEHALFVVHFELVQGQAGLGQIIHQSLLVALVVSLKDGIDLGLHFLVGHRDVELPGVLGRQIVGHEVLEHLGFESVPGLRVGGLVGDAVLGRELLHALVERLFLDGDVTDFDYGISR